MPYLDRIQRGIDHIEAHLGDPFELRDVSRAAGVSHWHFQRTFKALTGETLASYVRGRRLGKALHALLDTDERILDIALVAGFESQEAFTRAFKRAFDTTPGEVRRIGQRARFVKKPPLDRDYLQHITRDVSLQPEIVHRDAMVLVGLRTSLFGFESEKNNIASVLPPLWDDFMGRLEEIEGWKRGTCYGVVRPAAEDPDRLEYFAVAEVPTIADVPSGMVRLELPPTTYAVFAHRGQPRRLDQTVNYIYSAWLTQTDKRPTYGPDLEVYGPGYMEDSDESLIHYGLPIVADPPSST